MSEKKSKKKRLHLLDTIRGLSLIGMIFYHISYDIPSVFNVYPGYMKTFTFNLVAQILRIIFIFLSGYCACMGKKTLKRGFIVTGAGLIITLFTIIARFDAPIVYGILTFMGAAMILSVPFKKIINEKNGFVFLVVSMLLYLFTMHIHYRYFGFFDHVFFRFPEILYEASVPFSYITALFGLPGKGFLSSDYFPIIPWFFLYMSGFSFYTLFGAKLKEAKIMKLKIEPAAFLGRYSLWVYMLHMPIVTGILYLIAYLIK